MKVVGIDFIISTVQAGALSKCNAVAMLITDESFVTLATWNTSGITDTSSGIGNKTSWFHTVVTTLLIGFVCQTIPVRTDTFLDTFAYKK